MILYQRKALREARAEAEAAVALHPAYAEAWELLGAICFDLGEFQASSAALEKADSITPTPRIRANIALARERLKKKS